MVKLSKLTLILEILQTPEVLIYFKWKLPFISLEPELIRYVWFPTEWAKIGSIFKPIDMKYVLRLLQNSGYYKVIK